MPKRRRRENTAPHAMCFGETGAPLPCESDRRALIADTRRNPEVQPRPAQLGAACAYIRAVEPHRQIVFRSAWRFEIRVERFIRPALANHLQLRGSRAGQRKPTRD